MWPPKEIPCIFWQLVTTIENTQNWYCHEHSLHWRRRMIAIENEITLILNVRSLNTRVDLLDWNNFSHHRTQTEKEENYFSPVNCKPIQLLYLLNIGEFGSELCGHRHFRKRESWSWVRETAGITLHACIYLLLGIIIFLMYMCLCLIY